MNKLQTLKLALSILLLHIPTAGRAEVNQVIKIGSGPIIWFSQPSIIIGEGWDKEVGLSIEQKRFPGPAHLLQAFVQGELDGMNNNLGAAILSYSKGIKLKLISATIIGDISLLSNQNLIKLKNEFGQVEAIKKFAAANDRKLILVTNSKGSLSDLIARYWLSKNFPNYKSYIDIIHAGDIAQLQQIFILNKADLISSFIPIKESISLKRSNIDYFLSTKELMKNQPGGALAMRAEFLDSHKVEAHKLKILYQKATDLMLSDPDRAAKHIEKHLLGGLLTKEIIKEILIQNKEFFNTDLNLVKDNTQLIHDFMLEEKYINQPVNLDNIFN